MAGTIEILYNLVKVEGIRAAVLVGRDGFVIGGAGNPGTDLDSIGAVISTGFGSSETMGRELDIGNMDQVMAEFDKGVLVITAIGKEDILVTVTAKNAVLGNIRYQVKKYAPEIECSF